MNAGKWPVERVSGFETRYDMGTALTANKAARATAAKRSSGLTITTAKDVTA